MRDGRLIEVESGDEVADADFMLRTSEGREDRDPRGSASALNSVASSERSLW